MDRQGPHYCSVSAFSPSSFSQLLVKAETRLIPAEVLGEITTPDRGRKWQTKTTRLNDSKLKTDKD